MLTVVVVQAATSAFDPSPSARVKVRTIAALIIGSAVALVQVPLRLLHARMGHVNAPQLVKGINTGMNLHSPWAVASRYICLSTDSDDTDTREVGPVGLHRNTLKSSQKTKKNIPMNTDNNKTSKELHYVAKDPTEAPNLTKKFSQKSSWYKVQMGQMRARRKRQIEEQTANDMRLLSKAGKDRCWSNLRFVRGPTCVSQWEPRYDVRLVDARLASKPIALDPNLLSAKERNRLAHALNCNTSSVPASAKYPAYQIGEGQYEGKNQIAMPADGLCLYHAFACALGIGRYTGLEIEEKVNLAKDIKAGVLEIAALSKPLTAHRLSGNGPEADPGAHYF